MRYIVKAKKEDGSVEEFPCSRKQDAINLYEKLSEQAEYEFVNWYQDISTFDESKEHAKDWKQFVIDYVMWMTATKKLRESTRGKRVVKVARGYELQGHCSDGWGVILWTKNAANMYDELERDGDLRRLSREGDALRYRILAGK